MQRPTFVLPQSAGLGAEPASVAPFGDAQGHLSDARHPRKNERWHGGLSWLSEKVLLRLLKYSMDCECGLQFISGRDDEFHAKFHAEYLHGPSISILEELISIERISGHPLFVIDSVVPEGKRDLFTKVADTAQASMQDYPIGYDGTVDEREQAMFVLASRDRAIGMVIVHIDNPCWHLSWLEGGECRMVESVASPAPRRIVSRVWIAAAYRRQRLAHQLLQAVARHYSIECKDLGWELPLTAAGEQLLRRLVPGTWFGRADQFTLTKLLKGSSQIR